ncbi:MAG: hypothetical protein V1831_02935 [Candidatus Woesearchaeota archaeon]
MVLIMDRKKVFLLLIFLVFMISLCAGIVLAADMTIKEFIENLDFKRAYENYYMFIDTAFYFLFFLSIAKVTLGRHFEGTSGGNGVVIAVGLSLTVSVAYWAQKNGFMLVNIFPIAMAIMAALAIFWIWKAIKGGEMHGSLPIVLIITGVVLLVLFIFLRGRIAGKGLLYLFSFLFFIIICMLIIFGVGGRNRSNVTGNPSPNNGPEIKEEIREEEKEVETEEKVDIMELVEEKKLSRELGKLIKKLEDNTSSQSTKIVMGKYFPDLWRRMLRLYQLEVKELKIESVSEEKLKKLKRYIPGKTGKYAELRSTIEKERTILNAMNKYRKKLEVDLAKRPVTNEEIRMDLKYIKRCVDFLIQINKKEIRELK